jgi:uncharacterized protein YxeA
MIKCVYCGKENYDGLKYCTDCGGALPQAPQPAPMNNSAPNPAAPNSAAPNPSAYTAAPIPQSVPMSVPMGASMNINGPETNFLCLAGMIVSLVSILCCGITAIFGFILSLIGLIMAIKREEKGKGMAITGIVVSVLLMLVIVIFFAAGGYDSLKESVQENRKEREQEKTEDIAKDIVKESWIEIHSDSYLEFGKKKTFKYYRDSSDLSNNYYEGTYKLYIGQEAFDYITEDLSEYGMTAEELKDAIRRGDGYEISNLVCFVMENKTCMIDGENTLDKPVSTPYFGFYLTDKKHSVLDLANMKTATYYTFVPEDEVDDTYADKLHK